MRRASWCAGRVPVRFMITGRPSPRSSQRRSTFSRCAGGHDVPLPAAALQFPFGHRSVVAVIPGPVAPEEVRGNLAWMARDIPTALWRDLKDAGLIRPDAPTPA